MKPPVGKSVFVSIYIQCRNFLQSNGYYYKIIYDFIRNEKYYKSEIIQNTKMPKYII